MEIDRDEIAGFARKWGVREVSLFGSILRDDFGPGSDVDVLIALQPGRRMTLEADMAMREELSAMFGGRRVDMVRREYLRNPYRKRSILNTREVVYGE
jgi:uncharacterized protein